MMKLFTTVNFFCSWKFPTELHLICGRVQHAWHKGLKFFDAPQCMNSHDMWKWSINSTSKGTSILVVTHSDVVLQGDGDSSEEFQIRRFGMRAKFWNFGTKLRELNTLKPETECWTGKSGFLYKITGFVLNSRTTNSNCKLEQYSEYYVTGEAVLEAGHVNRYGVDLLRKCQITPLDSSAST